MSINDKESPNPETLIVLKKQNISNNNEKVNKNIVSLGGRIMNSYYPRLIIASLDTNIQEKIKSMEEVEDTYTNAVNDQTKHHFDETSSIIINAWNLRKSKSFQAAKVGRNDENKSWDYYIKTRRQAGEVLEGGGLGRSGCNVPVEDTNRGDARSATAVANNTSSYMTGTVAVGVVIVDGPPNTSAKFTPEELSTVIAEVQEGANHLIGLSPTRANLNFVYDVHTVILNLDPSAVTGEENWRDPAMSGIGYSAGSAGMYNYIQHLRTTRWQNLSVDWGYIAFFTKYNAFWFAYASVGGPRLVMQYSNNGWGPNQIDRVFAHESGHIFGAPDEYGSSDCSTGGSWGYLGVPNCNCEVNNPNSIDCLMKGNTFNTCQCTVGHFGWRDSDGDGIPDPIDTVS
jgi:hypothetical protein